VTLCGQIDPDATSRASLTITSFFSDTQIQAVIPGAFLANPDTATISVLNPGNGAFATQSSCLPLVGGGNSNPFSFVIGRRGDRNRGDCGRDTCNQPGRAVCRVWLAAESGEPDFAEGYVRGCFRADAARVTQVVSVAGGWNGREWRTATTRWSPQTGDTLRSVQRRRIWWKGAPAGRQVYLHDTCIGADNSCKTTTTLISTDSQGAFERDREHFCLRSVRRGDLWRSFAIHSRTHTPKIAGGAAANVQTAPNSGLRQVVCARHLPWGATNCTPKTTRISMVPGDAPANGTKPAGAGDQRRGLSRLRLADGKSATVFTPTVAVDEGRGCWRFRRSSRGAPSSRFYGFKFTKQNIASARAPTKKSSRGHPTRMSEGPHLKTHCRNFRLVSGH